MFSLTLSYRTTVLHLHGPGVMPPVRGAVRRPPAPPPEPSGPCRETIDLALEGEPASVDAFILALENALTRARTGADPVWLGCAPQSGAPYSSPVRDGWLEYLDYGSSDRARGVQTLRLSLLRADYWEGPEQPAPLTNHNGSGITTGLDIENHHDPAHQNYVDVVETALVGDLPAPARLEWLNTDPARPLLDGWLGSYQDSVFAPPNITLEGEDAATSLTTAVYAEAGCSNGQYRRVSWSGPGEVILMQWTLARDRLAALAGRALLPAARFNPAWPATDLWVQWRIWHSSSLLACSDWTLPRAGAMLQDLPGLNLPPWPLPGDAQPAELTLALAASRQSSDAAAIGVDMIQLLPLDYWRKFTAGPGAGPQWALNDDAPRGLTYAAHAASGELVTHTALGAPVMLWPGRRQRLWLLHGGAAMEIDHSTRVRLLYRPRRRVI